MHKIKPGIRWGPLEYLLTDEQKQEVTAGVIQRIHDIAEMRRLAHESKLLRDATWRLNSADPDD